MRSRRPRAPRQAAVAASAGQDAEKLKTAIFNAALNAVVVSDGEGRIVEFNPAAERIFGRSASEALALRMSDLLVTEPLPPGFAGNVVSVLGQRVVLDGRRSDGSVFPAEIAVQRVTTSSRTLFAAYIRDLTGERAAAAALEEQRQRALRLEKFATMSALLGGVAHELNNPLAILLTQSTLLAEKAPDQDVARRAEKIHAAAQRAGRLVKSLLTLGQQHPPRPERFDLNAVAEEALELVGYGLRSAGIDVVRALDPALPAVEADRDLVRQAIASLLVNAQEALLQRPAERRITLRSRRVDAAVEIEIEDNGPRTPARTGVALSLIRSIFEAHDGATDAISDAAGTAFRLRLPSREPPDAAAAMEVGISPKALTILIVDDEREVAHALAELIELFGHRVEVATDASTARRRVAQARFDVVFSDLRMPDMDGRALRAALTAVDPRLAGHIVIVTGDVVARSPGGADARDELVLSKPFAASEVKMILDRFSA